MKFAFWKSDKALSGKRLSGSLLRTGSAATDQLAIDVDVVHRSGLFDADWYRRTYPDVEGTPIDLARHYVAQGAAEGRNPHPLFSTSYYLAEYTDVAAAGLNPLVHYIKHGGRERRNPHPLFDARFYVNQAGRLARTTTNPLRRYLRFGARESLDPNPFFTTNWYRGKNPDVTKQGLNPLLHYLAVGEPNGSDPSLRFAIDWYLRCNIDVARAGVSPLQHYLQSGRTEGRLPSRDCGLIGPVTDAAITCLKEPSPADEVALFVSHSPNGHLKPHVWHHLASLERHGVSIILIVAADEPFCDADHELLRDLNGLYVRENEGFDFAAWAHVWRLHPELFASKIVYLVNDSVVGPTSDELFARILDRVRKSPADLVGLTDSHEAMWHLQSYFLAFKNRALFSVALRMFINSIVSHSLKNVVIAEYELQLAATLVSAGLSCEVVFPQQTSDPINRTLFHWKALLEADFPFIKVSTIRDGHPEVDTRDWPDALAAHGFDVAIAKRTIAGRPLAAQPDGPPIAVQPLPPPPPPVVRKSASARARPEFDADFYLAIYPDIAAAGVDAHDHYVKHGRAEGRLGRPPEQLDALHDHHLIDPAKETVLVVSHEGARGGAPILAYNLVQGLLKKHNVIALFLSAGPMLKETRNLGALVIGPIGLAGSAELAELVVARICGAASIRLAIVNTIASRYVLRGLARHFVPSVSLIHEFAAYIRPRSAFREAVLWSGEVVFSTKITRDNAVSEYPELAGRAYPILPQGRCALPQTEALNRLADDDARSRVLRLLRPKGFPSEGIVILGAGLVEFRKGVDLFIDCAAQVLKAAPDLPLRFAWIGRGYDPEGDVGYSVYLADQLGRHGISDDFVFLSEVSDLAAVYDTVDMLMLSSRLDPLPNVAIDALTVGLPVVCFAGTTGIADILTRNGLAEQTVAGYLDTTEMAQRIGALARSQELRVRVGEQSARLAAAEFNFDSYVREVERIGARQALQAAQERADVAVIAGSELPQFDFYLSPGQPPRAREDLIREYVRSWASGIGRRKLFPGFHPGIYREQHGLAIDHADPLADYIRAGRPAGPWASAMIGPAGPMQSISPDLRIGLHIHAYHLDVVPEMLGRLNHNKVRPDLLVSVKSAAAKARMQEQLTTYRGGRVDIRLVPDPGRDVGPFLTEFGDVMLERYDLVGHVHTKVSADLKNSSVGQVWVQFLLENVFGSAGNPMADIILGRMAGDPGIGMVFPDDPHVIGWDDNERFVEHYRPNFGVKTYPRNLHFPVGAMFWARPAALKAMVDLRLDWSDYPTEPLPYDGSLLHGLERLYGLSVNHAGLSIVNTYVPGVTR